MSPIFFISGAPGVGKSTTADHLAARFTKAFRIDLDHFRQHVVQGLVQPTEDGWTDEHTLQFNLAHTAAGKCAQTYAEAGFAVAIEHCSNPDMVAQFLNEAPSATVVCLSTELQANLERNRARTNKSFDPLDIEHFVYGLNEWMPGQFRERGLPVIENTNLDVEATVDAILALVKK